MSGDREHPLDPTKYGQRRPDGQYERHPTDEAGGYVAPIRYAYKHLKCGGVTTCGEAIAISYAKHPEMYGGTFCAICRDYFDLVTYDDEGNGTRAFVWDVDGRPVGCRTGYVPDEDRAEAGKVKR